MGNGRTLPEVAVDPDFSGGQARDLTGEKRRASALRRETSTKIPAMTPERPEGGTEAIASDWVAQAETLRVLLVAGEVLDDRAGMSHEVKSHLFEPFFATKAPGSGTELGLASVFGLVEQSGGAIAVESEPGRCTTYAVYLSLAAGQARPDHHSA
jgi:hypothetical protein